MFSYIELSMLKISIWNCGSSLLSTHYSDFLITGLINLAKALDKNNNRYATLDSAVIDILYNSVESV